MTSTHLHSPSRTLSAGDSASRAGKRWRSAIRSSVQVIDANGQISLGKQFAGRQVLVEEREPGVWLVRTVTVVPDNERWLHEPQATAQLDEALGWTQNNPPTDRKAGAVLEKLRGKG